MKLYKYNLSNEKLKLCIACSQSRKDLGSIPNIPYGSLSQDRFLSA